MRILDPLAANTVDVVAAGRHIECDGVFNLRDLGGYRSDDGRTVRARTMFRADGLHRVRGGGLDRARELGWRTVLDLRTGAEVDAGMYACEGVDVVHLPILRETWDVTAFAAEVDDAVGFLAARYLHMADTGAGAIAAAFELLASPARLPAVFHCAAGKDRTGILAALVLATLGVSDQQIAEDYRLSSLAMKRLVAAVDADLADPAQHMARQPPAFLACPPEAILGFLAGLRARHGSTSRYLTDVGVPTETLGAMREALLT